MKNFFCVFYFLYISVSVAQIGAKSRDDLRVVYKLEFRKRVGSDKISVEQMILCLKKNGSSTFLGEKMIIIDSIQKIRLINETDMTSIALSNRYFIERKKNVVIHIESVGGDVFRFEQNLKHNWKLVNESKSIRGFDCKKAILNFAGRDWVAWYATSIPSNSGPYKFYGLPGLILEVFDTEDIFNFTVNNIVTGTLIINPDIRNYFIKNKNNSISVLESVDFFNLRKKFFRMSFDDQLQYMNKTESGAISMVGRALTGEIIPTNRKTKEPNFIERFD